MSIDKSLLTGSTTVLILKLLEEKDMYGYEMISNLAKKSNHTFDLKAGTLYPLLHNLEKNGIVESYEESTASERTRKYYHLTEKGKDVLKIKEKEWHEYSTAVNRVLNGGLSFATR
ncbi:MAG: PadR family transcriptional regulator [Acutalibacteraceae bacterium]|nr:PadR family transcriptional regulator [Clostridia bacterium]MBQ1187326.1 PadR family transcriptional regulator [Clostridia bacterium]MEE1185896.1 PadR family transcriptional regulator [Acutalibacteraceae bacterium]MEE1244990.1 PadR family transcriptional regulator [Acutalibacteraceae bacterium]